MDVTLSPAKADLVQVARAEEALSRLAHQAAREGPDRRSCVLASDFSATPAVPTVDPTMRSIGGMNNDQVSGVRKSLSSRTARTLPRILLTAGLGAAATLGWQWYGEAAQQMISSWAPQLRETAALPVTRQLIGPAIAEQDSVPAVHAIVEKAAPQSPAVAHTIVSAATAAPSPELIEQLQAMAHDLASLRQRVEQLTAGQEQMARNIAKLQLAERDVRRRKSEAQAVNPASKPLPALPAPQTQQLSSALTPEALLPPPRPPEALR